MGEGPLDVGIVLSRERLACPLSFMAGNLPLFYIWHSLKSTLDTMIYETVVDILHLSGKKIVTFLIAASALAMLI